MVGHYGVSPEKRRFVKGAVAPFTVPVGAVLGLGVLGALALVAGAMIAHADGPDDKRGQQAAGTQRAARLPPPARVILPAPWEPAAPTRPVAPTGSAGRK